MTNSIRALYNQIAVSGHARETAINTPQTLDLSLQCELSDIITPEPRRENNAGQMTGKEEADRIYDRGKTASLPLSFKMAEPQHFALLYAYGLGSVAASVAGDGYLKTITPITGDLDIDRSNPSFTVAGRLGKTIAKERYASAFIDSLSAKFAKDAWVELSGSALLTGKSESSITEESITAAENVTALTLAANGVAGSSAAERLANIHQIRAELASGVWTEVAFSAVSAATPAVITITAPGATTDDVTYKVLYAPTELAWMAFPARVSQAPLLVSDITFSIGGQWNGTAIVGGRNMGAEINSIEHSLNNNGKVEFSLGATGSYASRYWRDGRTQMLKLSREFRDYIIQNYMNNNEYFAARILCDGPAYDEANNYQVELIFPKLGILKAAVSVDGKKLAEAGDLEVLEHDTYGSVIVKVKDLAATYAG